MRFAALIPVNVGGESSSRIVPRAPQSAAVLSIDAYNLATTTTQRSDIMSRIDTPKADIRADQTSNGCGCGHGTHAKEHADYAPVATNRTPVENAMHDHAQRGSGCCGGCETPNK
jgi:hypothetical protein